MWLYSSIDCTFITSYVLLGNLSLFASYAVLMRPTKCRNNCPCPLAFMLTIFVVDLRGKACYQRGHSAHYFKLANSTFVISILVKLANIGRLVATLIFGRNGTPYDHPWEKVSYLQSRNHYYKQ